jgi:hypothetical protein
MFKVIILMILLYAANAAAETADDQCLGVHKISHRQLSFFYHRQAGSDNNYFYVKAMAENEPQEQNGADILTKGENLEFVQNTTPTYYQVPEHAQRLYILQAKTKLEDIDPSAQVIPEMDTNNNFKGRRTRNVANNPQLLPPEVHIKPQSVEVVGLKSNVKTKVTICKLLL